MHSKNIKLTCVQLLATMAQGISYFSLRGFSGILLGIYGLLTVYVLDVLTSSYGDGFGGSSQLPIALLEMGIMGLVIVMIGISLLTLWWRARRKVKKQAGKGWNLLSKKLRFQTLLLVLFFIAVLIVIANQGYYSLLTPLSLFLYGVLLLNTNRLSSGKIKYIGFVAILLAILAYFIYDRELLFLAIGFGILPIVFGMVTLKKTIYN